MKVERLISFYGIDDNLVGEINIDAIGLRELKKIFNHEDGNPKLYLVYEIHEHEASKIKNLIDFDFT